MYFSVVFALAMVAPLKSALNVHEKVVLSIANITQMIVKDYQHLFNACLSPR